MIRAACFAVVGLMLSEPAWAVGRDQVQIDIGSGPLRQALPLLGRQAKLSVALADPAIGEIVVPGVRGRMSSEDALRRLVRGTPIRVVRLSSDLFRLELALKPRRIEIRRPAPLEPQVRTEDPPPIIVTASKRRAPMAHYPGSVAIVDGSELDPTGGSSGTDALIGQLAALGSTHFGTGRDKLFIRAISDSSFTGQTQSTVGYYFGETRIGYSAPDPSLRLYDVASVEVLSGPQGTLYGAGALGGILHVRPNPPDAGHAAAKLLASVAQTAHGARSSELAGVLNLPVARDGAIRAIAYDVEEGGYIDNAELGLDDVNRTSIAGGRVAANFTPAKDLSIDLGLVVQKIEGDDSQYADRNFDKLKRTTNQRQPYAQDLQVGYVTLKTRLGDADLTSTLSETEQLLSETFSRDKDGGSSELFRQRSRSMLQAAEFRLSGGAASRTSWVFGAHFLNSQTRFERKEGAEGALQPLLGTLNKVREQTLFGEISGQFGEAVNLTAGLRLTHARSIGSAIDLGLPRPPMFDPLGAEMSSWRMLPSLAASVAFHPSMLAYLKYQEGYRPGGLIVRNEATQDLDPDDIASWEAGFRFGQFARSRVSGAIALSYSRWRNIQADAVDTVGLPTTMNIGDGDLYSIDGSVRWKPSSSLEVSLSAVWNRGTVTSSGPGIIIVDKARLPNIAKFRSRMGISYHIPVRGSLGMKLSGWVNRVGKSSLGIGPILDRPQGNFTEAGFEAQLGTDKRSLFLRVSNLLDVTGNQFALGSVFSVVQENQITPLRPRTLRIGVQSTL